MTSTSRGWKAFASLAPCVLFGTGCPSAPATAQPDAASGDAMASTAPAPSRAGEGSLRRLVDRSDVPLVGLRVDGRKDDWLLESADHVAVVDARGGRVVDFGKRGGEDALIAIDEVLYLGLNDTRSDVVSMTPVPGSGAVLRIERRAHDAPLRLWTFVSFVGSALRIETLATSTGEVSPPITLGEIVAWGNVPTFVEGTGFVTSAGAFSGDFIAREGLGEAYALGREGARSTARFNAPQAGFHERAHTGEDTLRVPAGGESPRRVVWLTHAHGALGDAVSALQTALGIATGKVTLPGVSADHAVAEVAACPIDPSNPAPNGAPFSRFALAPQPRDVLLPHRCLRVRATAPGYASTPWAATGAELGASTLIAGRLRWHVTDPTGETIPARLVVRGIAPTPDPAWGDEPHEGAALDTVYGTSDGSVPLPPGRYRVFVSRGFEYTGHDETIDIRSGGTTRVDAVLDRVVDTRGWISGDLHVHAVPSPDAPILLEDRVRSLAAAGVEVAVATDHNAITDYGPTIRALGAQRWLASVVGDEVTTRGVELGHFIVFPLAPGAAPVPYENTTPGDIFRAARAAAPTDRDKIVQVNHPRMGSIGYFDLLRFDPDDFEDWRKRAPLFDPSFDALEVYNGDDYGDLARVETCLRDWYALLDAGLRITATGNSDSHKLTYHEAGVPRNFVQLADDAPDAFDERAFIDAIRRGRVVVSSGPFVRLRAGDAGVGDTIAPGDTDVSVHVEAPPWVDVSSVELVRRGAVVQTWVIPETKTVVRLDASVHLRLAAGDWIVAVVRGKQPMTYLHRAGALPFAFTNPIRVK